MSYHTVISISVANEIVYLTIRGRVVAGGEITAVREAIQRCVASDFRLFVVDLCSVDKIDAAGVSALVFAYLSALSIGARFRLAAVPPRIQELLMVCGLDKVLEYSDSVLTGVNR